MIEYQISKTRDQINFATLSLELETVPEYLSYSTRGDVVYVNLSDNSQGVTDGGTLYDLAIKWGIEPVLDAIDAIVSAHDATQLTDEQKSQLAEQAIQAQLDRSKRSLHLITPIYNQRAIDLNAPYGTVDTITAYNNVRGVIIATWDEQTDLGAFLMNYMRNICTQEQNIDFDNPVEPMTNEYASKFNEAVYKVIDSINSQYKF